MRACAPLFYTLEPFGDTSFVLRFYSNLSITNKMRIENWEIRLQDCSSWGRLDSINEMEAADGMWANITINEREAEADREADRD